MEAERKSFAEILMELEKAVAPLGFFIAEAKLSAPWDSDNYEMKVTLCQERKEANPFALSTGALGGGLDADKLASAVNRQLRERPWNACGAA
jgi:hypothetical protein